ncbi:MAG TPA: acetyl-CoA hydrolase/transferase C-terminal domain-containing protein [Steroidobacteraceae bacterium]|nr:acetyl-CoA hydrolase/transferase C-terminal domain-containing protein [Steroidobacteraceae bacterium]
MTQAFDDVGECVDVTLRRFGGRIVLALPLALGKPNPLVNEFYRRARRDPRIELRIFTALSLRKPTARSELERRFLEPFVARVFGDYPELDYVSAVRDGTLPSNIEVVEFFLEPGAYLAAPYAQQHYLSANYTHVGAEVLRRGVNVLAHLVAKRTVENRAQFSLSCNPDVTLDLLPALRQARQAQRDVALIGEVHRQLPFMFGDAEIAESEFDYLVDHPRYDFDLYCPPNLPLSSVDYCIALNASALVRDGGTLQIGIGELGDAIVYCLQLRHRQNAVWRQALEDGGLLARSGTDINEIGGLDAFRAGLYGCSEMFVDGYLDLYRSGILKRRVFPQLQVQKLLNEGAIDERITPDLLQRLVDAGLPGRLSASDFALLQHIGVFRSDCRFEGGRIRLPSGAWLEADLGDAQVRRELAAAALGVRLGNGVLLHGGFYLGPKGFYAALRDLPEAERRQFNMTSVGFINQLYGDDMALRVEQRRHARFINTAMMMTLMGAAVSDGLADGRVVSGVGGQYNFVAMAHALRGANSLLCVRSTRTHQGQTASNLVWNYAHCTIPRQLRDVVVTEYGMAAIRGREDREVIAALINIADSRFQESLLRQAQAAGKLPRDHRIPESCRNNTPAALERRLAPHRRAGLFSEYPFGTDFTGEEVVLAKALRRLGQRTASTAGKASTVALAMLKGGVPAALRPFLARLQLDRPRNFQELVWQRLVALELRELVN